MNPLQKLLWALVLLAGLATAAAGIAALVSPAPELPVLGELGDAVPASLKNTVWAGHVANGTCHTCENLQGAWQLIVEKLVSEPGVKAATIDNTGGPKVDTAQAAFATVSGEEAGILSSGLLGFSGPPPATSEIVLKNIGDLGDWSLTAENGLKFGANDLAMRIWIADFIFTSCAGPCPLMCDVMKKLVKRLPDDPRLRFVSFSVDPSRDKPEVLREFAKQWDAPPDRWRFVTGQGVFNLAYDGFKLEARPAPEPKPGAEFIHSTRFTLVDGRGRMRGIYVYDYEKPELAEALVETIARDTRALLETPERVVDHPHDARVHLVDRRGRVRGVYPADKSKDLVRAARRLGLAPDSVLSFRFLPRLNAMLNGASFVFLSLGLAFILNQKVTPHKACMTTALVTSTLFLVSYLTYHFQAGSVKYAGEGLMRTLYLGVLLSHTILAVTVAPLAIVTVVRAWKESFDRHKAIARWTLPIWMYVSLTGILVYLMLYQIP